MTGDLRVIQEDRVKIHYLLRSLTELLKEYETNTPSYLRRDFFRAYRRHAEHYSIKLASLIEISAKTRYSTKYGLIAGALLDRTILTHKTALESMIRMTRDGNTSHGHQAQTQAADAASISQLLESIDRRISEHGPTLSELGFLFSEEVSIDGGERVSSKSARNGDR